MQKNGGANLLDFLDNRQTSGRRRARRATSGRRRADVGHGTSGELKVVETEKNHLHGTEVEKLKKRNLSCDAKKFVKIRLSKHPTFEDVGRHFWENVWT